MNTKSAALLAVAVVSAALIIANARDTHDAQPESEAALEGDAPPARASAGDTRQPGLQAGSSQEQMTRLERQLQEARDQIAAMRKEMDDTPAETAPGLDEPAVMERTQSRFFALKDAYQAGTASADEITELLKLSKNKQLMGYIVSDLERKIAENPNDVDARLLLADVESSRVHIAESITERAMYGNNVRQQIEQVLKLDPNNWQGRFMKAVGISHSQRTPQGRADAIKEFESLLTLQQSAPSDARFAQTYEQLAIVYLSEKDSAKARATVQAGLAAYPDAKDLQELLKRLNADE